MNKTTSNNGKQLATQFAINEEVTFTPMYHQSKAMGLVNEETDGRITAIKFTESKVFYDVYSPFWGRIFENVVSDKVRFATQDERREDRKLHETTDTRGQK